MDMKIDFAKEKTYKSLMLMFVPILAVILLNSLCGVVDWLWVKKLVGIESYAVAVSNTEFMILLILCVGNGAANGVLIILSKIIGKNDDKETQRTLSTTFIMAVIFAAVSLVILEVFLPSILKVYLPTEDIYKFMFPKVYKYLVIYLIGCIPVYLYFYFSAVLKSYGNTIIQLIGMIICTILNAVLDPAFINIMGYEGAAAATVVSQVIGLLFIIFYIKQKKIFSINLKEFDKKIAVQILKKSIPLIIQQILLVMSIRVVAVFYGRFGSAALVTEGVIGKLEKTLLYLAAAFYIVLINIVAQCTGAGRIDRAKDYIRASLKVCVPVLAVLSFIVVVFAKQLSGVYLGSGESYELIKAYFIIVGAGYVLNAVTACCLGAINGFESPGEGIIIVLLNYIVVRVVFTMILAGSRLGIKGIWTAILISYITAAITAVIYVKANLKDKLS